jgi:hypothetical protein
VAGLHVFRQNILLAWVSCPLLDLVFCTKIHAWKLPQEEGFTQTEMNLSTRMIIIAVVAWVAGCAILDQELIPTLIGIVIIALLKPLVEKLYDRVRKE